MTVINFLKTFHLDTHLLLYTYKIGRSVNQNQHFRFEVMYILHLKWVVGQFDEWLDLEGRNLQISALLSYRKWEEWPLQCLF